jgi:hypothetical protein
MVAANWRGCDAALAWGPKVNPACSSGESRLCSAQRGGARKVPRFGGALCMGGDVRQDGLTASRLYWRLQLARLLLACV